MGSFPLVSFSDWLWVCCVLFHTLPFSFRSLIVCTRKRGTTIDLRYLVYLVPPELSLRMCTTPILTYVTPTSPLQKDILGNYFLGHHLTYWWSIVVVVLLLGRLVQTDKDESFGPCQHCEYASIWPNQWYNLQPFSQPHLQTKLFLGPKCPTCWRGGGYHCR